MAWDAVSSSGGSAGGVAGALAVAGCEVLLGAASVAAAPLPEPKAAPRATAAKRHGKACLADGTKNPFYSYRRASTGSSRAARQAG